MKFSVTRASDGIPIDDLESRWKPDILGREQLIEINTLEELLEFVKEIGVIILDREGDIEIYDACVE